MKFFEFLKRAFIKVLSINRPKPGLEGRVEQTGKDPSDYASMQARCINPDIGCPFPGF